MGIGKYFHREKSGSPQASKSRSRATSAGAADHGLQTSRYESMPDAGLPQTGTYPIKGNNSTAAVASQKTPFRSSNDPRSSQSVRPETSPAQPMTTITGPTTTTTTTTTFMPPRIPTPKTTNNNFQFFNQEQSQMPNKSLSPDSRRMMQDSGLEQNFSGLSMGDDRGNPTSSPVSYYPGSSPVSNRIDPRVDSAPRNDPGIRKVNEVGQQPASPSYGRQRQAPQQQQSPYNTQRPNESYPSAQGNYTAYPPTSEDYRQGYAYTPNNPTANKRASGDYSYGQPVSSSPTTNKRASGDYSYKQPASRDLNTNSRRTSTDMTQGYDPALRGYAANPRVSGDLNDVDGDRVRRRSSIPRKQVGSSSQVPTPTPAKPLQSSTSTSYNERSSNHSLPPLPKNDDYQRQRPAYEESQPTPQYSQSPKQPRYRSSREYSHPSEVPQALNYNRGGTSHEASPSSPMAPPLFPRAHPTSGGNAPNMAAQDIVHRAKTNTKDTEVIERIAPAVVQEKVVEKVHHKREEVITREIHTHDVFHRILPIIDVEVLPPRHFLPVEGGGLVEIGADEVPGRAKNWVIAETASKIPSDQPAPKGVSRFTAREFPGREGDTVKYTTPEGIQRTEETWVHPPELETGGRDSGQTWPMVFGREDGVKDAKIRTQRSASRDGKKRGKKGSVSAVA